jgi:hypothetical protein
LQADDYGSIVENENLEANIYSYPALAKVPRQYLDEGFLGFFADHKETPSLHRFAGSL